MVQPLSIGNVINVSIKLYRSHFKLYSKLSIIAHLWLLVPIYGWAKFSAICAIISRLTFSELLGQPESTNFVRSQVNRRMWQLLTASILVGLMLLATIILSIILFFVAAVLLTVVIYTYLVFFAPQMINNTDISYGLGLFWAVLIYIFVPLAVSWVSSRLFIIELPLAIEAETNYINTIKCSWDLTKGFIKNIQGVMAIAFLLPLPIYILVWVSLISLIGFIMKFLTVPYEYDSIIAIGLLVVVNLVCGAITMPFWQAIKAVLYYDFRRRREGLGWQLPRVEK